MNIELENRPLPVLLITGYLGSGKTTLLNRILTNRRGIKFAVIVNDLGEVNIDADLIEKGGVVGQTDDSLIALQNGCICCTLKMDLIAQLEEIARMKRFDYIAIEASGICEPAPIAQTINSYPHLSRPSYPGVPVPTLDCIVTVVDALRMKDEFDCGQALQRLSAVEFILHPQGVHHRDDAVQRRNGHARIGRAGQVRIGIDGLGDGGRLADAAGLDGYVVESLHPGDLLQLGDQVHLQRATDAAVLQGDQAVVRLPDHAAFFNQVGVDVDFTQVVDDHGELDAATVRQDAVQERRLAAPQIAGDQQHRQGSILQFDIHVSSFFATRR